MIYFLSVVTSFFDFGLTYVMPVETNLDPTNPRISHWLEEVEAATNQGSLFCTGDWGRKICKEISQSLWSGFRVSYVRITYTLCVTSVNLYIWTKDIFNDSGVYVLNVQ